MESKTSLIPVLSIASGIQDIEFYKKAFGAIIKWRLNNPDGSVHVAELSIGETIFRLHEENKNKKTLSPTEAGNSTVIIALEVEDVHAFIARALANGAGEISPVTDYEYGYRQGEIKDPFGHLWQIEKLINEKALHDFLKQA